MKINGGLSRRRILGLAAGALPVALLGTATTGCSRSASNDRGLSFPSLAEATEELGRLTRVEPLPPATEWNWAQTLVHCAQSIEYSLSGFPETKPRIFQQTAGAAAFSLFSWRGRMSHNLGEPIPGAPPLSESTDIDAAVARLEKATRDFMDWNKPLRPHFAYGDLDKADYEHAHAMHLADHFSAFRQLS